MPGPRFSYVIDQFARHHATRKTWDGSVTLKHWRSIIGLSRQHRCKSALDYGCGKGAQYEADLGGGSRLEDLLGYRVTKYDPAIPAFASEPAEPFDLVFCVDVLIHIPEEDIDWLVERLFSLASKALLITIGAGQIKKRFPDGSDPAVTVMPAPWWRERIGRIAAVHPSVDLLLLTEWP